MRYVLQTGQTGGPPMMVTLEKHLLGRKLAELREACGMSLTQAGEAWGWNKNKVDAWERGLWKRAKVNDLKLLLEVYGVTSGETVEACERLLRAALAPQWFRDYSQALDGAFPSLEARAAEMIHYQQITVPGLLQSPGYSAALQRMLLQESPMAQERVVEFRLERQRHMFGDRAHPMTFVVEEAVIERGRGLGTVWDEQARHIRDLVAEHPQITVHVLPTRVPVTHPGSFLVWGFREPWTMSIAYSEAGLAPQYVDDPKEVSYLQQAFLRLVGASLPPAESMETILKGTE